MRSMSTAGMKRVKIPPRKAPSQTSYPPKSVPMKITIELVGGKAEASSWPNKPARSAPATPARNPESATVAGVDHPDPEMEAREIDGRGESGRAAADDQAIEVRLGHRGTKPIGPAPVPRA